jgi:hypothetical protein
MYVPTPSRLSARRCQSYFASKDRDSFNVYACGAVHDRRDKSYQYQCRKHDKIDCKTCFDWVGFIKQQGKEAADQNKWLNKKGKYIETY